jgi:hypothetical protein
MEKVSVMSFTRTPEQVDGRFLIRSTCNSCGASALVSQFDDSLADWEAGHKCEERWSISKNTGTGA